MVERTEQRLLKIGEVARITGVPTKTLRYYEERGLLRPATRSESGYRLYGEQEIARLEFVRQAKLIGLKLDEIAELVGLAAEDSRGRVIPRLEEILKVKMEETERRMAELAAFRENLVYYQKRLIGTDPVESCGCGAGSSFCACLEAVTSGEGILIDVESLRRKNDTTEGHQGE